MRRSIETRLRAWVRESPDATDEQRRIDLDAIRASAARRWILVGVGVLVLASHRWLGLVGVSASGIVFIALIGAAIAFALGTVAKTALYRWWFVYVLAATDIILVSVLVVFAGPGSTAIVYLVAILPYMFKENLPAGMLFALGAAAAYVGSVAVHGARILDPPVAFADLPSRMYLDAALLVLVAIGVRRFPANLFGRLRMARSVMREAERGSLAVRAAAERSDELGLIEGSFNTMLHDISTTISDVQREADEVAVLAEVLSQAAGGALASSETVAETSARLAQEMTRQTESAEGSRQESTNAADEAATLQDRADQVVADARQLALAAQRGRQSVERAGTTLLAISEEVRSTADSVEELAGMSERVGGFARTISRIARQTHVLALNAAIEAAHSDGASEGFAAVAEEVRRLAAESARSAREVVDLIGDVQARIDAVSRAMASGQEKVKDVGDVARSAQRSLDDLDRGITKISDVLNTTAQVSHLQATRMAGLAERLAEVAAVSARSSQEADGAASALSVQKSTIGDLTAVSTQLAQSAERVRKSISRFSDTPSDR